MIIYKYLILVISSSTSTTCIFPIVSKIYTYLTKRFQRGCHCRTAGDEALDVKVAEIKQSSQEVHPEIRAFTA